MIDDLVVTCTMEYYPIMVLSGFRSTGENPPVPPKMLRVAP
jgi:hypothetical protein